MFLREIYRGNPSQRKFHQLLIKSENSLDIMMHIKRYIKNPREREVVKYRLCTSSSKLLRRYTYDSYVFWLVLLVHRIDKLGLVDSETYGNLSHA